LMALCCCIKGVSVATFAMGDKNIAFVFVKALVYKQFIHKIYYSKFLWVVYGLKCLD
jgi:hypothetical protein